MEEITNRFITRRLIPITGWENIDEFCRKLKELDAYIAGSFPLQAVLNVEWKSDVDIWVYDEEYQGKNLRALIAYLLSIGASIPKTYSGKLYEESNYSRLRNDVHRILECSLNDSKIQIVSCKRPTLDIIRNFDLTICEVGFDGEKVSIIGDTTMDDIINHRLVPGTSDQSIFEWYRTFRRMIKYIERGFVNIDRKKFQEVLTNAYIKHMEFLARIYPDEPKESQDADRSWLNHMFEKLRKQEKYINSPLMLVVKFFENGEVVFAEDLNPKFLDFLLENHFDFEKPHCDTDKEGRKCTFLGVAIRSGNVNVARFLIEKAKVHFDHEELRFLVQLAPYDKQDEMLSYLSSLNLPGEYYQEEKKFEEKEEKLSDEREGFSTVKIDKFCVQKKSLHGDDMEDNQTVMLFFPPKLKGECYLRIELEQIFKQKQMFIWEGPPAGSGGRWNPKPNKKKPVYKLPWSGVWVNAKVKKLVLRGASVILLRGERKSIGSKFGQGRLYGQWGGHWKQVGMNAEYVESGDAHPDKRSIVYTGVEGNIDYRE